MSLTAQQHKVFLQKRSLSGEMKVAVAPAPTISCSLCPASFPGAKELGLHILAAHCPGPAPPGQSDSLVIPGSPGLALEVEGEELQQDPLEPPGPPSLNLPRQPTQPELKQKFMIYRLSDTSSRYICLVCDKMYTSRYNIRMHMNLHSGNNVHKCAFCGRNFAHKHVYESHVRTHTGERPFACGKCDRRFGDRSNCSSHRKRCSGTGSSAALATPPDSPPRPANSINIAPNVSITPINRKRPRQDGQTGEMFEYADIEMENMDDIALSFKPQIISVETINREEEGQEEEMVNMGYVAGEDDEYSEEMMIEPDISLDYDDIEEMLEEEEGEPDQSASALTIITAQKPVSSTIFTCSFCNVKYSQQPMLLEHLSTHIDIPSRPTQSDVEQGYMAIYYTSRPKFMCLSCGKLFATAESVNLHLNIHYEDKIYACEHCDKIFAHKHVYESHRKSTHRDKEKSAEFDCVHCNNVFPNAVSLSNHVRVCKLKPREITPMSSADSLAEQIVLQLQNPVKQSVNINNNNNINSSEKKQKPKANRPPPKLIQLTNSETSEIKQEAITTDDHILINESAIKTEAIEEEEDESAPGSPQDSTLKGLLAPKPTLTLLSEEAKKIYASSAPQRQSSGSNPRAHKIVETDHGREYIPDTNSNNIIHLEGIQPAPDSQENRKGYMLRPVGPGGQQRYICVECGKHYTTSYNVRMHRNIHLGKNLYNCKFCNKEFSHKHVWEVSMLTLIKHNETDLSGCRPTNACTLGSDHSSVRPAPRILRIAATTTHTRRFACGCSSRHSAVCCELRWCAVFSDLLPRSIHLTRHSRRPPRHKCFLINSQQSSGAIKSENHIN